MSTLTADKPWSFGALISWLVSLVLNALLSKHVKRLFFFASLYANILPLETLKKDAMARLNLAMDLASCDDALVLPTTLSRMVWSHDDVSKIVGANAPEERIELRAYKLISIVPTWMRFGTTDVMKEQVEQFLRFSDRMNVQATTA